MLLMLAARQRDTNTSRIFFKSYIAFAMPKTVAYQPNVQAVQTCIADHYLQMFEKRKCHKLERKVSKNVTQPFYTIAQCLILVTQSSDSFNFFPVRPGKSLELTAQLSPQLRALSRGRA